MRLAFVIVLAFGCTPTPKPATPVDARIAARIAAGRAWLAVAHQLAATPEAAYGAAKRGIDELGSTLDLPIKPIILDDTDNHVHIAEEQATRGDFADAASELERVLESRIAIFIKKSRGAAE